MRGNEPEQLKKTTTMKTKIIKLTLDGFHGLITHSVKAEIVLASGGTDGEPAEYFATIAPSAARKFACRVKGCTCGESMPDSFTLDAYDHDAAQTTVNGNYPSRR